MRLVVQRVRSAGVTAGDEITGKIGQGLLVYVGLERTDTEREVRFMADKVLNLRIFPDKNGRMDVSVMEVPGSAILSVSQFTLASAVKKGRKPDFSNAMEPANAEPLYHLFNRILSEKVRVETGIFGAMMLVSSVNDGPVTFIIEKNF